MIDLTCTATQPGPTRSRRTGRCQLLAGHEGPHAVMYVRAGRRLVRTWERHDRTTVRDHELAQPNLPWAYGMPRPAWGEPPRTARRPRHLAPVTPPRTRRAAG